MALSAVVDLTLSAESEVSFAVLIADTSYTKLFSLNQTSTDFHRIVPVSLAVHQPMVSPTSKTATLSSLLSAGSPLREC